MNLFEHAEQNIETVIENSRSKYLNKFILVD
ncbi:hypothetical protein BH20ACI1_BH20ACI1_16500 [soil metagenome]